MQDNAGGDAMQLKRKIAMLEAENKQLKEKADAQGQADGFHGKR